MADSVSEKRRFLPALLCGTAGLAAGCLLMFFVIKPAPPRVVTLIKQVPLVMPTKSEKSSTAEEPFDPTKLSASLAIDPPKTAPSPFSGPIVSVANQQTPLWGLKPLEGRPIVKEADPKPLKSTAPKVEPISAPISKGPLSQLRLIQVAATDPSATVTDLAQFVGSIGGKTQTFSEETTEDQADAPGILLFVSPSRLDELSNYITSKGSVKLAKTWSGPIGERQAQLERLIQSRLIGLQSLRQDLMKSYKATDLPVIHVDEDIQRAKNYLSQLAVPKGTDDMVAVKLVLSANQK